jgi:hypothetical protein
VCGGITRILLLASTCPCVGTLQRSFWAVQLALTRCVRFCHILAGFILYLYGKQNIPGQKSRVPVPQVLQRLRRVLSEVLVSDGAP